MQVLSKQIDWKKVPIRCHCLGQVITPPKDAARKAAGEMGDTAIKRLVKIYALEKWGRDEFLKTDPIMKGIIQEGVGIEQINRIEKEAFVKNEERLFNKWFSGTPDFFKGKTIQKAKLIGDCKCPYTLQSFLENEITELKTLYKWQLTGYGDLAQCSKGAVYFTLVDAPASTIMKLQNKLRWDLGTLDADANPEYVQGAAEIEFNMTFSDIPEKERVIKIELNIDNDDILKAHKAVEKAQEWLAEFDEIRMSRYK